MYQEAEGEIVVIIIILIRPGHQIVTKLLSFSVHISHQSSTCSTCCAQVRSPRQISVMLREQLSYPNRGIQYPPLQ